jgi:hypothetical protein
MQLFQELWSSEDSSNQVSKAARFAIDAEAKLRSGDYGVAQQLAMDAVREFEKVLAKVKQLQEFAASLAQDCPQADARQEQRVLDLSDLKSEKLQGDDDVPDGHLLGTSSSSMSAEDTESIAPLVCKVVKGRLAGNDEGSGAIQNLAYYEAQEDGWLMLGHGVCESMVVVRRGPWVKKATAYKRCWIDAGSKKEKDYAIYIPSCADPNYVACGVVFVFKGDNWHKPRDEISIGLIHRSLVEPISTTHDLWSDHGTGSAFNVNLRLVPRLQTAWPSRATLLGQPPTAFSIRSSMMSLVSTPSIPMAIPIRNTFLHYRRQYDIELQLRARSRSWPASPAEAADAECWESAFDPFRVGSMAVASLERLSMPSIHGTCASPISVCVSDSSSRDTPSSQDELVVWDLAADRNVFPSSLWCLRNSSGYRSRDRLYAALVVVDIARLSCCCSTLRRWARRTSKPPDSFWYDQEGPERRNSDIDSCEMLSGRLTRWDSWDEWRCQPSDEQRDAWRRETSDEQNDPFPSDAPQHVYPSFSCAGLEDPTTSNAHCVRRRKPSDAIIPFLAAPEVHKLREACTMLKHWFQAEQVINSDAPAISHAVVPGQSASSAGHASGFAPEDAPGLPHSRQSDTLHSGGATCQTDALEPQKRSRRARRRKLARAIEQAELENALRASAPRSFVFPDSYGHGTEEQWQPTPESAVLMPQWLYDVTRFQCPSAKVVRGTALNLNSMI